MIPKNSRSADKTDTFGTFQMQHLYENETRNNLKDSDQQSIHADMKMLQSPIFNIHIHVPPFKGDSLKMYLPKIQPVIHLHFDELAKSLKIDREEQSQVKSTFQNLLKMTAPKFGGVKFHYRNKSNEAVISESEFDRATSCPSENYSSDIDVNKCEIFEPVEVRNSDDSEITNCYRSHNNSTNSNKGFENTVSESNSNSEETSSQKLKKKFNLKEPVVVLMDVCKTNYFKYMVAAGRIRDLSQEYKSESDALSERGENTGEEESTFLENEECMNSFIKTEACSPESSLCTVGKSVQSVSGLNTSNHRSCTHSVGLRNINSVSNSEKTLTDLAEGCRFFDILSRFQFKHSGEFSGDFGKHKDDTTESGACCTLTNNEECHCKAHKRIQEYLNSKSRLNTSRDNTYIGNKEITQILITSRNMSHDSENKPHCQNFRENIDIKDTSLFCRHPNKHRLVPEDTAFQLQSNDSKPFSDVGNIAAESQPASNEVPLDSGKVFSPSKASNVQQNCELPQTKGDSSVGLGITHLQFDLIRKAMGQKLLMNNVNGRPKLKKKPIESESSSPDPASLPKKMKRIDANSNKTDCKTKTSTVVEDYIPLEASGPTKFVVAPLNKINPHKSHDARNFRKEMLFGNRIRRFCSPDHLRIYQLKQKAAKSQSD